MNVRATEEYIPLTPQCLQVLLALTADPSYGYNLIRRTDDDSEGRIRVGEGSLYRALQGLENWCMVETYFEGRTKRYALTATGRTVLEWGIERLRIAVHLAYERLGKSKSRLSPDFFKGFTNP